MSNVISLADFREAKFQTKSPVHAAKSESSRYAAAVELIRSAIQSHGGFCSQKYIEALAVQQGIDDSTLWQAKRGLPIYSRLQPDGWYWGIVPRGQVQPPKRKLTAAEKAGIKIGDRVRHSELGDGTVIGTDHAWRGDIKAHFDPGPSRYATGVKRWVWLEEITVLEPASNPNIRVS